MDWESTLPEFQVVTGISAGAILATDAFVGDVVPLRKFGNIQGNELVGQPLVGGNRRGQEAVPEVVQILGKW